MLYQDNYFVVSVELSFCQSQTHSTDHQDKCQSDTAIDNEFTDSQIPKKKLQSIGISPLSLYTFMKAIKNNISEAYNIQVDF